MIKTLSPHYIPISLTNPTTSVVCNSFVVKLYVWNGLKSATPAEPSYTSTITNATGLSGFHRINVSNVINDFIDFQCVVSNGAVNGNNQVWVKLEVYYDDTPEVASINDVRLATKGYGYFPDGENPQLPADDILLTGDEFKVSRNSRFVLPVYVGEPTEYGIGIEVISYPLNEISFGVSVPPSLHSAEIIKYFWLYLAPAETDEYVEIKIIRVGDTHYRPIVKTLLITDECRYTPVDIAFQNKEGALQTFTFFKAKKDSITIDNKKFEGNRSIGNHQFIKYNVNAKSKFTLNSGFNTEDKNEAIKQLLLSERVWMLDGTTEVPLNVSTTSMEYKTRQNDRLINYTIEFEYAFSEINNV